MLDPANAPKVVVVGAGGHGSEIHSYLLDLAIITAPVHLIGFVDDNHSRGSWLTTTVLGSIPALKDLAQGKEPEVVRYITAVGDNATRRSIVQKIEAFALPNLQPWTLKHPTVQTGFDVQIGEGTLLAPGVVITTGVRVGAHSIVNVNVSIAHDCVLGDFVNLNPGATVCGNVRIGEGCYIGAGATVIDKVSIGDWAVIGAGAVVISDIPSRVTAVGVPARVIKQ